ncbi:hypothetical protein GTR02_20675 [Kineococcus sp. R8]|uniref:hypothetical protein n=1 Tax=Kineococcus siccus TaxID=2696567 RepID=UPI001411DC20|nr:hypothetical protein [Kineococcus siccus]NAZ84222.1 hypothetical protein [Kineococcus siccus]
MPSTPDDGSGPLDVDAAFAEIVAHWGDTDLHGGPGRSDDGAEESGAPAPRPGTPGARAHGTPETGDAARTVRPARPLPPAPREDVPAAPPGRDEVDEDMALAGLDEGFVPPEPQPLPRDLVGWGAWVAVVGAPLFLLVVALAWRSVPPLVTAATALVFVAGFATLVVRLPSSRDDDSDDGAVV